MRDASGQIYMRNRYYDPASGQFTQPDPIGLAGGLNAFGFANGDPVSYSDPYGLQAQGCNPPFDLSGCRQAALEGAMQAAEIAANTIVDAIPGARSLSTFLFGRDTETGAEVSSGTRLLAGGAFVAQVGSNALPIGRGLRGASSGLRSLFKSSGGLADETLIGVRSTLSANGFTVQLANNRRGYLFTNGVGEEVRLMRGNNGWYLRVRNSGGNYLDANGNPASQAATHLSIRSR